MLYEIFFDALSAEWRIRLITRYLGFIPITKVIHRKDDKEPVLVPRGFETYDKAAEYATSVGLEKAYRKRTRFVEYSTWVQSEGCHAQG